MLALLVSGLFLGTAAFAAKSTPTTPAASAAAADPDRKAVEAVCGRCHTTNVFLSTARSWTRWNDVFAEMSARGAHGSDEQLAAVTRYFYENLTLVNVNTSPAEELALVLGVDDEIAQSIVATRGHRKFTSLADLAAIKGIDKGILQSRKDRILF
jgi:DNA uptake protein ComE-like DNA-binding protein